METVGVHYVRLLCFVNRAEGNKLNLLSTKRPNLKMVADFFCFVLFSKVAFFGTY